MVISQIETRVDADGTHILHVHSAPSDELAEELANEDELEDVVALGKWKKLVSFPLISVFLAADGVFVQKKVGQLIQLTRLLQGESLPQFDYDFYRDVLPPQLFASFGFRILAANADLDDII